MSIEKPISKADRVNVELDEVGLDEPIVESEPKINPNRVVNEPATVSEE